MSRAARTDSCPLCGEPVSAPHKPFCGQRCRDRDLLKWLGEGYRVPGEPVGPEAFQSSEDGLDSER